MSGILDQDFPDEEDDDFNPQPEIGSDEEAEADSRASDRKADVQQKKNRPQVAVEIGDEDDDSKVEDDDDEADVAKDEDDEGDGDDEPKDEEAEEDEEEEDDEDEDDDIEGQPSRKRRKKRRNQFIDVEAEVDEDDEEEPEEEDDLPGEEMHPDDLQELPPGADRDDRMHRELDRERERQEAMDVEETAARLKERYGRQSRVAGAGSAIVPQRLLLPGVGDPRIWRIKCRPGKEREIIFAIQHRIFERANSREPIRIISAFERSGPMSGNLYLEAARQDDILPAVDGISSVFSGTKPMLIPLEEMPDLLRTKKSRQLDPGMYVRMKRGLYAGDLALVDAIESNGTDITVKLVPRLDYGMNEDANAAPNGADDGPGGSKRKRVQKPISQRPPPRLFSESEARKRHGKYLQSNSGLSNNSWTYQGKEYTDGFLIHTLPITGVLTANVNPTLEEVTKFAAGADDGTENLDLAALAATLKQSTADDYLPGDNLEIFRGEQKGVVGRAVQVYGDLVKIRVEEGSLSGQVIEAPIRDLRKLFHEGDHVKVIGGSKFRDEVGMVVRTKDDRVTILTDSNQQEVTVFSKDLREATDSGGVIGFSQYDLFELVQLDAATVGCVIKVDRESLRVLDQNGSVRSLLPSNISNRIERRKMGAVATDREGNEMKIDDSIKEYGGEQRSGHVLHLHRNFVFALNRESRENAGVFVARHNNVVTVAAKGGRMGNGGPDLSKMNPMLKQNGGAGAGVMLPPQQKGRDRIIGKHVKVRTGPQKGFIGIVKDSASGNGVIVELHARNKKTIIDKSLLAVIDPISGKIIHQDARTYGMGRPPPTAPPGHTGTSGGQTPGHGFGAPPPGASGGRTPAYAMASGRTPAWKQDAGARTPSYTGGGQTSYGGYGGSTSYGGGTSYGGATTYGGGSVWGGGGGGGGVSFTSVSRDRSRILLTKSIAILVEP